MMGERNLCGAGLPRNAVEHTTAQPGAEGAGRRIRLEQVVHHLADRRVLDAVLPAALLAGSRNHVVLVVLVARVDVDGDEREVDRRPLTELVEDLQEGP